MCWLCRTEIVRGRYRRVIEVGRAASSKNGTMNINSQSDRMRTDRAAWIPATLFSFAAASALAVEVSYTVEAPLEFTDWDVLVTLPQHDPAVGGLQEVRLTFEALNQANSAVENRDPAPVTVTISARADVHLTGAGFGLLSTLSPTVSWVNNLGEFDGSIDFDGASGVINPTELVGEVAVLEWTPGTPGFDSFVGTGDLVFGMGATALPPMLTGAISFVGGANVQAGAVLTLTYVYVDGGGGGTGGLTSVVWVDADGDGVLSPGESGLAGATVTVTDSTGVVVATGVSGSGGEIAISPLGAGEYQVSVVPAGAGNWVATTDPDGLLTPGSAVVVLTGTAVQTVGGFGFVITAQALGSSTGPGYWAGAHGQARILPVHLALLNGLPLVDRNGDAVEFSGDLATGRRQLQSWLRQGMGRNAAGRLSQHLAAYVLGLTQGTCNGIDEVTVTPGGVLPPLEVFEGALAALELDGFTPPRDPNRALQQSWTEVLSGLNGEPCDLD